MQLDGFEGSSSRMGEGGGGMERKEYGRAQEKQDEDDTSMQAPLKDVPPNRRSSILTSSTRKLSQRETTEEGELYVIL